MVSWDNHQCKLLSKWSNGCSSLDLIPVQGFGCEIFFSFFGFTNTIFCYNQLRSESFQMYCFIPQVIPAINTMTSRQIYWYKSNMSIWKTYTVQQNSVWHSCKSQLPVIFNLRQWGLSIHSGENGDEHNTLTFQVKFLFKFQKPDLFCCMLSLFSHPDQDLCSKPKPHRLRAWLLWMQWFSIWFQVFCLAII